MVEQWHSEAMSDSSWFVAVGVEEIAGTETATAMATEFVGGILVERGGQVCDAPGSVVRFVDAAAAVEAAVVGQWTAQRADPPLGVKVRIGIDSSEPGALALLRAANGNQILMSNAVDQATGGMIDARPMGMVILPGHDAPGSVWLSTDSRPDIDGRPPRLDHLQ